MNNKMIGRMVIAGGLVGIFGVALFLGLWLVLGSIGISSFARLILSLCLPPIILAMIFGMYYLVVRPGSSGKLMEGTTNPPSDLSPDR